MTTWKGKALVAGEWRTATLDLAVYTTFEDVTYASLDVAHPATRGGAHRLAVCASGSRSLPRAWADTARATVRGLRVAQTMPASPHRLAAAFDAATQVDGVMGLGRWFPDASDELRVAVDAFAEAGGVVRACDGGTLERLRGRPQPVWVVAVDGERAALAAMEPRLREVLERELIHHLPFARTLRGKRFVHVGARADAAWEVLE